MTFISYAQNFEDVLLWRALGHVKDGFYIDVGANDPEEHSVTKAFYDAGWHGINIEPLPLYRDLFAAERPRDINLSIAVGSSAGSLTLFDVPSVPGWASPELAVAEMHRATGHEVHEVKVPVRTLASVCEEHARGDIHFLKVDVEGHEGEVLRGMDFGRFRPWVVVVEATLPNSRQTNHEQWESLVTTHGYRFAHFDGLNRYYVADEHAELADVLSVQPNVFDAFISHHLDKAWRDAKRAHYAVEAAQDKLAHETGLRWQEHQAALKQVKELEQKLDDIQRSTSWRITHPLRIASSHAKRARGLPRELLRRGAVAVTRNERLRKLIIPVLLRFPGLAQRVSATLSAIKQGGATTHGLAAHVPPELRGLPLSARRAAADLKRALGNPKAD